MDSATARGTGCSHRGALSGPYTYRPIGAFEQPRIRRTCG